MSAKAYKLFRIKNGKLYPLYVLSNKETILGKWLPAEEGELREDNKVKSKLGGLAYRPGWHCADLPYASHIGVRDADGTIAAQHPDTVWAEVLYEDRMNWQKEANENGIINGKFYARNAYLKHIPYGGFYRYKTSPLMTGDWIITSAIKVLRVLTNDEVAEICRANNVEPQPVL